MTSANRGAGATKLATGAFAEVLHALRLLALELLEVLELLEQASSQQPACLVVLAPFSLAFFVSDINYPDPPTPYPSNSGKKQSPLPK